MKHQHLATIFAALLCVSPFSRAVAQEPVNTVPTALPGVTTAVDPPAGFNPLEASDEELAMYAYPPRPDAQSHPAPYASWRRAMLASRKRMTPELKLQNVVHGPVRSASIRDTKNTNVSSSNWSGSFDLTGATSYNNSSTAYYIVAEYVVPPARQAYGACTGGWDYSSSWIGMDGATNGDVLQAGTESDAFCLNYGLGTALGTNYYAWYEWYPNGSVQIGNFPIAAGNDMFVEVWNASATQGYVYMLNYTTDQYVVLGFIAPGGANFTGSSFDWIVERPEVNGSLATLTNYVFDYFSDCYGVTHGGTEYTPGSAAAYQIWMNDNSGHPISYPYPLGPYGIWFQDEGSAR